MNISMTLESAFEISHLSFSNKFISAIDLQHFSGYLKENKYDNKFSDDIGKEILY